MKIFISFLYFTFSILFSVHSLSQPSNDAKCGALSLTVGGGCVNSSNVGATTEGMPVPSCYSGNPNNYSNSVWYSFVATDDSVTVNIGDGPTAPLGTQTLTSVYSSSNNTCTGAFTEIGCEKGGNETSVTGLVIGNTYFIMIDGSGTNTGDFCISAYETPPPPPPVGSCKNPRDMQPASDCNNIGGTQYDEQNNIISTNTTTGADGGDNSTGYGNPEAIDGSCADNDLTQNAYWVRFTATNSTTTLINGGGNTLDYAVYKAPDCTPTPCIACSSPCDNTTLFTVVGCYSKAAGSSQAISTTLGSVYYVMITQSGATTNNNAYLCLTSTPAYVPPNNTCGSATVITAGVEYTFSNGNATVDGALCSGSTENNIWAKWTAPLSWSGTAYVHLYNQDCACGNGLQMSIYNAGITCTPSGNQSGNCQITLNPNNDNDFYGNFTPTPGTTYIINIDGYAGCACYFNFKILGTSALVPGVLTVNAGTDGAVCSGSSDTLGSAFTATGGSGSYSYLWSPSTGLNNTTIANPISTPSSTTAYIISVTDNVTGCIKSDTATVTINACGGCTLTASATGTNLMCNAVCTGQATGTGASGTFPYTYKWTNGQTTQSINSLCAGTYMLTVKDANSCITTKSVIITQPNPLVMTLSKTYAVCNCPCPGKAFVTNITGGSHKYSLLWSTGATTSVITDLCPGTYSVAATDSNSCSVSGSVAVP